MEISTQTHCALDNYEVLCISFFSFPYLILNLIAQWRAIIFAWASYPAKEGYVTFNLYASSFSELNIAYQGDSHHHLTDTPEP